MVLDRPVALRRFVAELGYAVRHAARGLSDLDKARFVSPVYDVMDDLGGSLRAYLVKNAKERDFASAPSQVSGAVGLLVDLAVAGSPVVLCLDRLVPRDAHARADKKVRFDLFPEFLEPVSPVVSSLDFAAEALHADRDEDVQAVLQDCPAHVLADEELHADRDVVNQAVQLDCSALELADDELHADRDDLMQAVALGNSASADLHSVLAAMSGLAAGVSAVYEGIKSLKDSGQDIREQVRDLQVRVQSLQTEIDEPVLPLQAPAPAVGAVDSAVAIQGDIPSPDPNYEIEAHFGAVVSSLSHSRFPERWLASLMESDASRACGPPPLDGKAVRKAKKRVVADCMRGEFENLFA